MSSIFILHFKYISIIKIFFEGLSIGDKLIQSKVNSKLRLDFEIIF